MVYDLDAYWLVYPVLLKTERERERRRRRKDRCCLKSIILGSVMGYVALLCVSAQAAIMYGSFIEALIVELYLYVCSWPASKITVTE